jgi:hypothetical protein
MVGGDRLTRWRARFDDMFALVAARFAHVQCHDEPAEPVLRRIAAPPVRGIAESPNRFRVERRAALVFCLRSWRIGHFVVANEASAPTIALMIAGPTLS